MDCVVEELTKLILSLSDAALLNKAYMVTQTRLGVLQGGSMDNNSVSGATKRIEVWPLESTTSTCLPFVKEGRR